MATGRYLASRPEVEAILLGPGGRQREMRDEGSGMKN